MVSVNSIFTDAIANVQASINGMIGTAAPAALALGGAILAITLGWRLFKRLTK